MLGNDSIVDIARNGLCAEVCCHPKTAIFDSFLFEWNNMQFMDLYNDSNFKMLFCV